MPAELDEMELKKQISILKVLLSYALFERKQESELSMAFSILVQERHNQFHTLGGHKEGDESSFGECDNEICKASMNVLKNSRSMSIEINDFTIEMIAGYEFKLAGSKTHCTAWLNPREETPKIIQ
jgi:hypothetical protein